MKRLVGITLLILLASVPAAIADSWSLDGSSSQLRSAQNRLQQQGINVSKRPGRLIVEAAERQQLTGLAVEVRKSIPVKLAQDPLIPDADWYSWNGMMGIEQAWQLGQGQGALVAVIDSGIDLTHPDLKNNLWVNPNEVPANGIDDDSNGYIDDINGASMITGGLPIDGNGHGTHVSGIIGAALNGFGVNGLAPQARIMPVAAINSNGDGTSSDIDAGIHYAVANGAQIINISITSKGITQETQEAIDLAEQAGILVVAAAGNENSNLKGKDYFPTGITNPNMISVGSVTNSGKKSSFSNYGPVDLAAFGNSVPSTWKNGKYALMSGTSMASPMVAGGAALLAGLYPTRRATEWKQALLKNTLKLGSLKGLFRSGGIPDLPAALAWQAEQSGQPASTSVRFHKMSIRSHKSSSQRLTLKIRWALTGAGAKKVSSVKISAQKKSRITRRSSVSFLSMKRGRTVVRLSARNKSGLVLASKTIRFNLR